MNLNFDPRELTKEKSMFDIFRGSLSIGFSKFNKFLVVVVILALTVRAFVLNTDTTIILDEVRKWSDLGFSSSIAILGFLIAGFTIFATLTKPDMLLEMMNHKEPKSGLPFLKYNFFCFMRVFIYYIVCIFLYLSVMLFGSSDGLFESIIRLFPNYEVVRTIIIKVANIVIGSTLFFLLIQLKSFIFNIYTIVMNSLRWDCNEKIT